MCFNRGKNRFSYFNKQFFIKGSKHFFLFKLLILRREKKMYSKNIKMKMKRNVWCNLEAFKIN